MDRDEHDKATRESTDSYAPKSSAQEATFEQSRGFALVAAEAALKCFLYFMTLHDSRPGFFPPLVIRRIYVGNQLGEIYDDGGDVGD